MFKRVLSLLIITIMAFSSLPAFAADTSVANIRNVSEARIQPVIFEKDIVVTEKGGKFEVGFVTLDFPKNFLDDERLPKKFHVAVFAQNGEAGVEVTPSTDGFKKNVHIKVDSYKGLLYDKAKEKNIPVSIKKQVIKAEHFSWFRFR